MIPTTPQHLNDQQLQVLADLLGNTCPDELTCEEWLDHVGHYLETTVAGGATPEGSELIEQHLSICPECREEFDSLVVALKSGWNS